MSGMRQIGITSRSRASWNPPNFLAYCVREDRVAAVAGFDRDSDMAAMVLLMQTRADWTPDRLRAALQRERRIYAARV